MEKAGCCSTVRRVENLSLRADSHDVRSGYVKRLWGGLPLPLPLGEVATRSVDGEGRHVKKICRWHIQAVEKACHCEPVRRLAWQSVSKASPYTGEVAKISDFCRRGCPLRGQSPSQRFALTAPFTQGGLLLRLFYRRSGTSSSRSTQSCTSTVENSVSVLRMTTLESPALMTSRRHMAQEVAS